MSSSGFANPFRPGAGHSPPYLAGRRGETHDFLRLLTQDVILENLVLTGLRGVGKTVLLDTFQPPAISQGWLWVGTDLSESSSISEDRIALRLITDLAPVTSSMIVGRDEVSRMGFRPEVQRVDQTLDFETMQEVYQRTPGLVSDKIKAVLDLVWHCVKGQQHRGIIFAYDEAQNLSDLAPHREYPLSLLLDVFQSIQKKGIPFMLALAGLPTLFPKLVEARTFAERMFHVVFLGGLGEEDCRDAILKPIEDSQCPVRFSGESIETIIKASGGYPYFIQFICREVFDLFLQNVQGVKTTGIPIEAILRKLDTDFFAGRWARATDRQRDLLVVIANLENCDSEFTVQEAVEKSNELLKKPFGASQVNQMLAALGDSGLVYKNRHGKYSFAVPLMGRFIRREQQKVLSRTRQLGLFD